MSSTEKATTFRILALPSELRCRIFFFYFTDVSEPDLAVIQFKPFELEPLFEPEKGILSRERNICLFSVNKQFYREGLAVRQACTSVLFDTGSGPKNKNELMSIFPPRPPKTIAVDDELAQQRRDNVRWYQGLLVYLGLPDYGCRHFLFHTLTRLLLYLDDRVRTGTQTPKTLRFVIGNNMSWKVRIQGPLHNVHEARRYSRRMTQPEDLLKLLITGRPAFRKAEFSYIERPNDDTFNNRWMDPSGWMDHPTFAAKMLEYYGTLGGTRLKSETA